MFGKAPQGNERGAMHILISARTPELRFTLNTNSNSNSNTNSNINSNTNSNRNRTINSNSNRNRTINSNSNRSRLKRCVASVCEKTLLWRRKPLGKLT